MMQAKAVEITVNEIVRLTEFRQSDKSDLVQWLNDREISNRTLRIPHPYTANDALTWLSECERMRAEHGQPIHFAIRQREQLVGACGFEGLKIGMLHRAELGYWLARPYWGRGIMTAVVATVCGYAFDTWGLRRITAHVFEGNSASSRILEKNGFRREGLLRRHYLKNGEFLDAEVYGLLDSDFIFRTET